LPVEIITYGILFVAIVSVLAGLYLKVKRSDSKIVYGRLDYECKPAKDVDVYTSRLRLAKTAQDGSFSFDVSGMNFKNLRLSFMQNGARIGDTTISIESFDEELKIKFGDCSPYTSKVIKGRAITRQDGIGRKGLKVSLVGYNYITTTGDDGYFTLKADSILKLDLSSLVIEVKGNYEGSWPLNSFKGFIPVDKKK
jgi:hypothetical protein